MNPFLNLLEKYDKEAMLLKNKFENNTWLSGIYIGLAAVFIFALSVSFPSYLPIWIKGLLLPLTEVLLILISIYLLGLKANPSKTAFLQNRHWAEYLRLNEILFEAGLPIETNRKKYIPKDENVSESYIIPQEIKDIEQTLTNQELSQSKIQDGKKKLVKFIISQQKYHTDIRIEGYEHQEHQLEKRLKWILISFVWVVLIKLVLELMEYLHLDFIHHNPWTLDVCKFLVIFLPPLYAALEGIAYFREWKRNVIISKDLNDKYEDLRKDIEKASDPEELIILGARLERLFWKEQLNWLAWFDGKKIEARV